MTFMERFSIKGKKIFITGGAQGIGKIVADAMASCGADIGIFDMQYDLAQETAKDLADKYSIYSKAYECDVTDPVQTENCVKEFVKDFGTLDGVFNNAGICIHKSSLAVDPLEWQKVINVNLNGIFYVACAAAKQFLEEGKRGAIVNTASMSGGIINIPQAQASYNSSKAAVVHLTKSLAVEWAEQGIRVNCISPGYIWTDMTALVREDWREFWTNLIPFKRMGTPDELAGGVIYLLSDAASYTSGCNLIMDGCFTCI